MAGREHLVRLVLRGLHVGLVERVDLEIRAGDGGRELPAEELLAERVRVGQLGLRRLPVGAVRRLAGRGDEALAVLARRLGDELLGPEAEVARASVIADLVAPVSPALAERSAELEPGIALAERHASRISCARSSMRPASAPISAAGTIPNGESAE